MQGRICKGIGSFYTVVSDGQAYVCRPRGHFREEGLSPQVGDWVEFEMGDAPEGAIEQILPRTNLLPRPPLANVQRLVWVLSAQRPAADLLLLDKMLLHARALGLQTVVLVNKCDLVPVDITQSFCAQFAPAVDTVLATSAQTGRGIDALREVLQVGVSCFAGQSGAGKSSLLGVLLPQAGIQSGALSQKTGRGKQTTRHTELFPITAQGYVADTPGFQVLESKPVEPMLLKEYYPEFQPYAGQCRYTGCLHLREPLCAVRAAVETGSIHAGRYARYQLLLEEMQKLWRNRYD